MVLVWGSKVLQEGLIVESRFSLRKTLVRDFDAIGAVSRIYEATSVRDGLDYLSSKAVDTCLLGPSLTLPTAEDFVKESRRRTKNPDFLILAVRPSVESSQRLLAAGLHGVIPTSYDRTSFTEIVARAISQSDSARAELLLSPLAETLQTLNDAQAKLTALCADVSLSGQLDELSQRLRIVVRGLGCGSFSLKRDGTPSLATQDAIRLALEETLKANTQQPGTFDSDFVEAVVTWFRSRVLRSHQEATRELREELLAKLSAPTH